MTGYIKNREKKLDLFFMIEKFYSKRRRIRRSNLKLIFFFFNEYYEYYEYFIMDQIKKYLYIFL